MKRRAITMTLPFLTLLVACSDDDQGPIDSRPPPADVATGESTRDSGPTADRGPARETSVDAPARDSGPQPDAFVNTGFDYEWIDIGGDPGKQVALALHEGKAYVSYRAETPQGELRFATNESGAWQIETVATGPLVASFTDIGVDTAGKAHIAECDGHPNVHFEQSDGSFAKSSIAPLASGWHISMTFLGDRPYLCHADSRGEELILSVYQDGGNWSNYLLEGQPLSNQRIGAFCDIAVDGSGVAHISYADENWMRLKYIAVLPGVDPSPVVVDSGTTGPVGTYTSIALDSDGRPWISYFRLESHSVELSHRLADDSWSREKIDDVGSIAVHTALALGSDGFPRVSYFDSQAGAVRFAQKSASGWQRETIAFVGTGSGGHNDLALDADDRAHIVYYHLDEERLAYARQQ